MVAHSLDMALHRTMYKIAPQSPSLKRLKGKTWAAQLLIFLQFTVSIFFEGTMRIILMKCLVTCYLPDYRLLFSYLSFFIATRMR